MDNRKGDTVEVKDITNIWDINEKYLLVNTDYPIKLEKENHNMMKMETNYQVKLLKFFLERLILLTSKLNQCLR